MLKASPRRRAPGRCRGAAGMSLFCMLLMFPLSMASRKLDLMASGIWGATWVDRYSAKEDGSFSPGTSTRHRTCSKVLVCWRKMRGNTAFSSKGSPLLDMIETELMFVDLQPQK